MAKDYYKILGVDRNFDENQLKKAFRKKSIEWHPDRWQDKSEAEKKNAEEQFKLVAEAYACLKDPEKRARYDQFGDNWDQMNGGGGPSPDIEEILKRMHGGFFDDFFGGGDIFGHHHQQRGPEPGQSIQMQYKITLDEIYNGVKKEIEIPIQVRCKDCNGTGGETKTCQYCHGQGVIVRTQTGPFGMMQSQSVCPHCHGTGKQIVKKCNTCNGQGMIESKRKITLNIAPFTQNGVIKTYTAMGYESRDKNGLNGDFILQVIYDIDKTKYVIQGNNVYEKLHIPYYDAILGTTVRVKLPDNKEYDVKIPECSKEGDQLKLKGKGISYGDYIYVLQLDIPKILDKKEKELIEKIKKLYK